MPSVWRGGLRLPPALVRRRRAWAAGAFLCLLSATALLGISDGVVSGQRRALAQARVALDTARGQEAESLRQSGRVRLAARLVGDARTAGYAARDWDERRFNLRQSPLSREAVNGLVDEVERGPGRLFAAEQFEVSVRQPDEGVFSRPLKAGSELVVTLRGSLVYRAGRSRP